MPKGDGKHVRLVTDYTKLNHFVVRPVHPFPSVAGIIQNIPVSAACFAKLEATHGYFQIPLNEEASKLTTFILPVPVISTLTTWFNLFGWPTSIRSDGGPQFRGEFSHFCETHHIRHELSAPYNPKSNGLAEAGAKSVKNISIFWCEC